MKLGHQKAGTRHRLLTLQSGPPQHDGADTAELADGPRWTRYHLREQVVPAAALIDIVPGRA
jgi:hypothetical protein